MTREDLELETQKITVTDLISTNDDFSSQELRNIAAQIFFLHAEIERQMERRIILEFFADQGLNAKTYESTSVIMTKTVFLVINSLSFYQKLDVIKDFHDKELPEGALRRVNAIRNEFAHPRQHGAKYKYDINTIDGKQNVIKILKDLTAGVQAMSTYMKAVDERLGSKDFWSHK